MKGKIYSLAVVLIAGTLGACSHKNANAPLSYVPANTPFLAANLKPMDADLRESMYKQANMQMPMQLAQMRQVADKLDADHKPQAAALIRAFADEFDGRTIQQVIQREGFDPEGLFAFYGVGMSPVIRTQLADPKAFNAFVGRLEKAWGAPMATAKLDSVSYRQAVIGDKVKLRFVAAVEHKQAVLALVPADADPALMRSVLGLTKPHDSIMSTGKLEKLAQAKGYQPYMAAYIDLTQWPALIAGEKDPMVKTLLSAIPQAADKMPASCESDLARIAARMPMLSSGMTSASATSVGQRLNVDLAPDIAKVFADIDVKLPVLNSDSKAPLDFALALPVKEMRGFWTAQADAVAAKPFTCPALTGLNDFFAKARMGLMKTAMPPVNDLRGVRVILDSFEMPAADTAGGRPKFAGQVLIGSDNPQGMLAMAQMTAPPLRDLQVSADGKPVALPASLSAMTGGQPMWAAMNDHVLAVAIGAGEDQRMARTLSESGSARGVLGHFRIDGKMYRQWLTSMAQFMDKSMQKLAENNQDASDQAKKQADNFRKQMQDLKTQAEHIDSIDEKFHATDTGIVVDVEVQRH